MRDLNDLKINCTEKILTPVLTEFALKYETMALSCNRASKDRGAREQKYTENR